MSKKWEIGDEIEITYRLYWTDDGEQQMAEFTDEAKANAEQQRLSEEGFSVQLRRRCWRYVSEDIRWESARRINPNAGGSK